jgi:PAS domain S-box-containing protein
MTEEELCSAGNGLFQRDDAHHASFLEQRARTGKMTGELSWSRRDGSKFTAEVSSVILGGEPPRSFVVLRDITQRKAAEEALRANEERMHGVVSSAMDAIISVNEQQRIIVFNRAAEKIFRCAASEALGSPLDRFIPAEYRAVHQQHIRKFAETGRTACSAQAPRTLKAVRSNGEEFPIEIAVSRVQAGKERIYTAILRDITRRTQAEEGLRTSQEQMRALAARVQSVAEEERLRISRELHDQLGQALTAIKMDLDWLARKHEPGEEAWTEQIRDTLQLVDSTIGLVRKLSTELRPAILDTCGLSAALELQAEEFRRRTGIPCCVQAPQDRIGLSPAQRITVFRICQEVLTNIARHARASRVEVTFEGTGAHAVFTIKDDGKGFNIDKLDPRRSLGILGMRERALMAGGMLEIRSAPGAGTQITLRIPLNSGRIGAEEN